MNLKTLNIRFSTNRRTLRRFSHDASIFEIVPKGVAFPKAAGDVEKLVRYVAGRKATEPNLSLTPRSGGTDMSGGAINDSIIVNFMKLRGAGKISRQTISVQPGLYYRQLDKLTRKAGLLMPAYPASRDICQIGGMVANNAGGEKSLAYGKVEDYVLSLKVIMADGKEHTIKPLSKSQHARKLKETSYEAGIYRRVHKLIKTNARKIDLAKPKVSKNSTGYNLWDVWNGKTFDLTKLFVGSQGTLGIITEITLRLMPRQPASGMMIIYLPNLNGLARVIRTVTSAAPTSFEAFDDNTIKFAIKSFLYFRSRLGTKGLIKLGLGLLPELLHFIKGLPRLVLLVEFEGLGQPEIDQRIKELASALNKLNIANSKVRTKARASRFWLLRRESFNILRHNVHGAHTAPFIDDFVVPPENLENFLPRLQKILNQYKLTYTIAGHLGEGNFHIIPLMKLQDPLERAKIEPVMLKVNELVIKYGGSLSGEHNDGLVRGPFLHQMYSKDMLKLFRQVKIIFDPKNIFNPHKKTDATWEYSRAHIRKSF